MAEIQIVEAEGDAALAVVRELLREYVSWLGIDLYFQEFDREFATLPGEYAPPRGALLLAQVDSVIAGCVAMRPLGADVCEMKRLWVREPWRGRRVGVTLVRAIMKRAANCGYARMRLDTLPKMDSARLIYIEMGFREIAPYYWNPDPQTLYLEADLH